MEAGRYQLVRSRIPAGYKLLFRALAQIFRLFISIGIMVHG
jgi:hypothetical protein